MTSESVYARAYARALLSAAQAAQALEEVSSDMLALGEQWDGSRELRLFCRRQRQDAATQRAARIDALWGGTLAPATLHFLRLLSEWGHLRLLRQVVARFAELADRAAGRHHAVAVFACEPAANELARVRQLIAAAYGPLFNLDVRVDGGLLAGVRLRVDDRLVDASLAGRLARLKNGLLKPAPLDAAANEKP